MSRAIYPRHVRPCGMARANCGWTLAADIAIRLQRTPCNERYCASTQCVHRAAKSSPCCREILAARKMLHTLESAANVHLMALGARAFVVLRAHVSCDRMFPVAVTPFKSEVLGGCPAKAVETVW